MRTLPYPEINAGIFIFDVDKIVSGNSPTLAELKFMCQMVEERQPRKILEIGTFLGHTIMNLRAYSIGAKAFTIDLPLMREFPPVGYYNQTSLDSVGLLITDNTDITQLLVDSRDYDYSDGPFDFIFIDGCHHYDYVKVDSEKSLVNLSEGGVILWHDYGYVNGVTEYLDQRRDLDLYQVEGTRLVVYEA